MALLDTLSIITLFAQKQSQMCLVQAGATSNSSKTLIYVIDKRVWLHCSGQLVPKKGTLVILQFGKLTDIKNEALASSLRPCGGNTAGDSPCLTVKLQI